MRRSHPRFLLVGAVATITLLTDIAFDHAAQAQADKGKSIFDGKSLDGWHGDADVWSVENGAITGRTTEEKKIEKNTFLIFDADVPDNFQLRLKFKIENGNSGVQFRSEELDDFVVRGYQADIDASNNFTGILYEERGRGILARRGEQVMIDEKGKREVLGETSSDDEFASAIKDGDWNDYVITARGNRITQTINGVTTIEFTDGDPDRARSDGILAFQVHTGPPMKVQFKDIKLEAIE